MVTPLIFWMDARLPLKRNSLGLRIWHSSYERGPHFSVLLRSRAVRALLGLNLWSPVFTRFLLKGAFHERLSLELA